MNELRVRILKLRNLARYFNPEAIPKVKKVGARRFWRAPLERHVGRHWFLNLRHEFHFPVQARETEQQL